MDSSLVILLQASGHHLAPVAIEHSSTYFEAGGSRRMLVFCRGHVESETNITTKNRGKALQCRPQVTR